MFMTTTAGGSRSFSEPSAAAAGFQAALADRREPSVIAFVIVRRN